MDFKDLHSKHESLRGTRIMRLTKNLTVTHYALNANFRQIVQFLNGFESDSRIFSLDNRNELNALMYELSRLFLNYVSSSSALVDHVRKVRKEFSNKELDNLFEKNLANIKKNEYIIFFKDLRNYTIHDKMPPVLANFRVENKADGQVAKQSLCLAKDELLKSSSLSGKTKIFLNSLDQEIDIKIILEKHHTIVDKFHKNFYQSIVLTYKEELRELKLVEKEIQEWMTNHGVN